MSAVNYATPILYINMGGEMLYVLQQRLQTQKISADKTVQVLTEVIEVLLKPKQLERIWRVTGLGQLRPILERVVLSSIMRLDANSMAKLFDLMIMMVKFQLATASGPRELLLSSLNHLDAIREMAATDAGLGQLVDAWHRLLLDTYGQMTHERLWQIRAECLRELQHHNVRVSILLRLGAQNPDASFNRLAQSYDERYQEREQLLGGLKLVDLVDAHAAQGQLSLFGDRVTLLGRNAYCAGTGYGLAAPTPTPPTSSARAGQLMIPARSNEAMRQELETLAAQLGKEETGPARPFSLQLHVRHDCTGSEANANRQCENESARQSSAHVDEDNEQYRSVDQYKSSLIDDVNAQFEEEDDNDNATRAADTVDLMNLLDIV